MTRLFINGIDLHIAQQGQGEPLVMLHGLNSDISSMRPEIDALSRSFRIIALDSRGHGRSSKPAHYTLQDHVGDVLGVMDALDIAQANLMGTSMGSYIAQATALAAPQRISKLVLVVPKPSGQTSSSERFLAEHAEEVRNLSPEQIQAFMLRSVFAPETPAEVRQQAADLFAARKAAGLAPSPEQAQAANKALEGFDFRPQLPSLNMPVLVISGRHDPLNPPVEGAEIARLVPGARQVVLEHSGHLPALEQPRELFQIIEDFLKS